MFALKWIMLFLCAFAVAFVIVVTFSQEPFKQMVPAVIFTYHTRPIALYWYVAGALAAGFAAGLCIVVYQYITLNSALYKKDRHIRELEALTAEQRSAEQATHLDASTLETHQ
jgi:uncharacterized membrane protein YciS (DUF1049 family)